MRLGFDGRRKYVSPSAAVVLGYAPEELVGREASSRKRWDFLVTASPAAVPGATGSVLNPIATF